MPWYKFAKNYVEQIFDKKEEQEYLNAKKPSIVLNDQEHQNNPDSFNLDYFINSKRKNTLKNVKQINEYNQPNQYFSHGQGGDYRMQEGKDLVWNQTPNNFTGMSDWNN
jgi:hypothetical protein